MHGRRFTPQIDQQIDQEKRMQTKMLKSALLIATLAIVLAACGAPAAAPPPTAPAAPAATAAPAPTAAPAAPAATAAPAPTAASAAPAATAAPAASEPVTFTFAHPGPIRTMDAPVTWFGSTHWLTNGLYDCLIWRKADGTGYDGQAAERWEQVNPTTWRFFLRPNLTFQNGEPLNAEAVKWNIDRVVATKEFMVQPQWQFVQEVKAVDPTTVDVITDKPHAYFEYDVSFNGCQLLPPKYYEQIGPEEFAKKPVGSGPFKLVELVENQRYVFEAWDGYWGGKPAVDRVIYQVIPEQASQIAALLAGQVDMVSNVPLPDRERLGQQQGVTLLSGPANRQHLLYLRNQTESGEMLKTYPGTKLATENKLIRQAISHALDRKVLAEVQGSGRPSLLRVDSFFPEARGQWAGEEVAVKYFDPEKAKTLIRQAGFNPDAGNKPVVQFDTNAFQQGNEKEVAEVIKTMLEDVGFTVNLNVLDGTAYNQQILTPGNNRDLALVVIGGSPSLIPTFYQCTWKTPAFTPCNVVQGEWETLGQQILSTTNEAERLKLWESWWNFYVDEAIEVTLYHMDQVVAMNSRFDWTPRADGWYTFRDLKAKQP
jgi:peptide/nickel transport system substrate-binding protein